MKEKYLFKDLQKDLFLAEGGTFVDDNGKQRTFYTLNITYTYEDPLHKTEIGSKLFKHVLSTPTLVWEEAVDSLHKKTKKVFSNVRNYTEIPDDFFEDLKNNETLKKKFIYFNDYTNSDIKKEIQLPL